MAGNYIKHLPYEYSCGANVSISMNDIETEEVVGITYTVLDSATPIYGYCSRLFDAVAPGQKIVQGSFVINYVEPNYIYNAMLEGNQRVWETVFSKAQEAALAQANKDETFDDEGWKAKMISSPRKLSSEEYSRGKEALRYLYYGDTDIPADAESVIAKDVTLIGPGRIQINFGGEDRFHAKATTEIHGVYIIGEGSTIQIDENVILEEYNFIGRDLVKLTYDRSKFS